MRTYILVLLYTEHTFFIQVYFLEVGYTKYSGGGPFVTPI